jgi:hypothetical protein
VVSAKETGSIVMDASAIYYAPEDVIVETTSHFVEEKELLTRKIAFLEEKQRLEQAVRSNQELISQSAASRESLYPGNLAISPPTRYFNIHLSESTATCTEVAAIGIRILTPSLQVQGRNGLPNLRDCSLWKFPTV